MALNFILRKRKIEFDDGENSIEVRGLSVSDVSILIETHRDTAERLFDKFTGRHPDSISMDEAADVALGMVTSFPTVMAHVIALAADANDRIGDVVQLPVDVQVAALEAVAALTISMTGGLKNFVEMVLRMAQGANHLVTELKTPRN